MVPEMPSFPTLPNGNEVRGRAALSLSLSHTHTRPLQYQCLSLSLSDTHTRCATLSLSLRTQSCCCCCCIQVLDKLPEWMNPSQARSTSGRLAAGAVLLGAGIGLAARGR